MAEHAASSALNPAQRQAVEHCDGPILVVAGPGSGKTRVLTHRIAHLVATGVPAENILAITFTNKAASEMLERTVKLLDTQRAFSTPPLISTFHSYCARLLRRSIYNLDGYHVNFTIYDTLDQRAVIDEILTEKDLEKTSFPAAAVSSVISFWKNDLASPEEAFDQAMTQRNREIAQVYRRYQELLAERNALDFDDLLLLALRVLRECEDVRERERHLRRYVLIDEFQDTNRPQYLMARLLAEGHRNLCITGDPDQSIYSWRGASPINFEHFEQDFPERETVLLSQNYRSSRNIITVAGRLTGTLLGHRELFTENPAGELVTAEELSDERSEARRVVRHIYEWQAEGTPLREIAILYRINAISRSIEEAFIREQIPYIIIGGVAFYQRKEIKDILAYLRAATNPRDQVALKRVINTPNRGIGNVTLDRLEDCAREHALPLGELIEHPELWERISARARSSLRHFAEILERIRDSRNQPLDQLVIAAIRETGYEEFLERTDPEGFRDRLANLEELTNAASETEEALRRSPPRDGEPSDPLAIFLERVSLVTDIDAWEEQQDRVALMTLHAAKGLEFDRVIIPGVEETLLPHSRSQEDGSEDEERRLLYVGITRARETVKLLHCSTRFRYGQREPRLRSKFLEEIAGEGMEAVVESPPHRANPRPYDPTSFHGDAMIDTYMPDDDDGLRPGVILDHDVLGRGLVVSASGHGASRRVTVRFRDHGEKQFVVAYTPFRIVGYDDGPEDAI